MGHPKAEIVLGGKTLLERAVETMSLVTDGRVTVVVRSRGQLATPPRSRVIEDNRQGEDHAAIFGLHAALADSSAEWVAILAVDLPLVTADLFTSLLEYAGDHDAVVPLQADGRRQPLAAIYRREACSPTTGRAIASNEWRLTTVLGEMRVTYIDDLGPFDREKGFLNVNTVEDLRKAEEVS